MKIPESIILETERLSLRPVALSDATEEYVGWLNDRKVNMYLDVRFEKHTLENLQKFVGEEIAGARNVFLAIIRKDTGKHIGNIKLSQIDWRHCHGEIGILIGHKASWGKGFATEAIRIFSEYAFSDLKLHKLIAGAYSVNQGSWKAFLKAGFRTEATLQDFYLLDGKYYDRILLTRINPHA